MDIYSIYKITNNVNGKVYVGWTSRDPLIRFEEHQIIRKPKKQDRSIISYAIEKYEVDSFTFEIIYQSYDYNHSRQIETYFITEHNSLVDQWGYNQDLGGTGHKRTQATIEKHRAAIIGRKQSADHIAKRIKKGQANPMFGKTGELHHRYGTTHSDEERQRISNGIKKSFEEGRIPHRRGKKWTEEQKQKIREGRRKQIEAKKALSSS